MDRDQYEGLVRQLEAEAEHNPGGFRNKVLLISSAAYIALALMLVLTLLIIYFGVSTASGKGHTRQLIYTGLFTLTMIPVYFVVLRMFFMRLEVPAGREITRKDAPKLFEVLDKMRRRLKGPAIDRVVMDREFNAAISQVPRFGLFGGHSNHLILGLPYLFGVTPKEMLATVAHEYGHLCGNHGKIGSWVYRQRRTFGALHEKVASGAEDSWVYATMAGALNRFWPYYNAYTFVMSRQDEYEADLTATELTGTGPNASGLIRGDLLGQWMAESFWPKFYKQADTHPQPTFMPFTTMPKAFGMSYGDWATQERLTTAWQVKSDLLDTHPCLQERVTAIGEKPALPPPVQATAAEALLGPFAKQLATEFDKDWWLEEKKRWVSRHQYVTRAKQRLQELSGAQMTAMPLHDLQEFALLKAEFDSLQAAKPVLEYMLGKPGGPYAKPSFYFGRILLDEKNDKGLDHLLVAAKADRNVIDEVVRIGYHYLRTQKSETAAEQWLDELNEVLG
ncbi:MAG: M48 family metalloprotease [Burkholderiales bacterium]|nr:M48 family metalloprotease [Burkholderiales bacterium]